MQWRPIVQQESDGYLIKFNSRSQVTNLIPILIKKGILFSFEAMNFS